MGHWLGLQHTFDNGCGNPLYCYATGDNICDTPPKSSPSYGCSSNGSVDISDPSTWNNTPVMQCGYLSNVQNFMDYQNDRCMLMFTQGQKTAMRAVLNGARSSILTSPGCTPICTVPTNLGVNGVTNSTAGLTWNAAAGAASYSVQYRKFAGGPWPWTTVTVLGTGLVINNLAAFTPYEFRVQANCINGVAGYSAPLLFWTLTNQWNCGFDQWENAPFLPPMQNGVPVFGLICPVGDVDFQLINNQIPNSTINIVLDQLPADYDLELRDYGGNLLAGSYNPGLQNEVITYPNLQPGYYYPTVFSNTGMANNFMYFRLTMWITPPDVRVASLFELNEEVQKVSNEVVLYPNPSKDFITLSFHNEGKEDVAQIRIIDLKGSVLDVMEYPIQPGSNQIELDFRTFDPGSYFINFSNGVKETTIQMILQR